MNDYPFVNPPLYMVVSSGLTMDVVVVLLLAATHIFYGL